MRRLSVLITGMAALAFGQMAGAVSILAPNTPHVSFNCIPLGSCFDPGRYQQVYVDSIFSGLTQITQIAFSVDADTTWGADIKISLGYSDFDPAAPGVMSTTLDDNIKPTTVLTEVLNDATFSQSILGGADTFGLVFDINPFIYNPLMGNLLLDIVIVTNAVAGMGPAFSYGADTGEVARAWNSSTSFGTGADGDAMRTLFTVVDLAEPGTLGLLAFGFVGAAWKRRRKLA